MSETKVCCKCYIEKPASTSYFYIQNSCALGLMSRCIDCVLKRNRKWAKENPQCGLESGKRWLGKRPWQHRLMRRVKQSLNARKHCGKNCDFNLTPDDLVELFDKQRGLCAYSGIPLQLEYVVHRSSNVSVDRIDSSGGYTKGNVQLVCRWINFAKGATPHREFLEQLRTLYVNFPQAPCNNLNLTLTSGQLDTHSLE